MRTFLRRILILVLFVVGDPTPTSLLVGFGLVLPVAGPSRWVRNPFYTSNFLTDAGFCVVALNPYVAAAWFILFYGFVIHPRTLSEERELLQIHGQAYQDYLN